MLQPLLREIAVSSFGVGLFGLSVAIPGFLRDWNEYFICEKDYAIETCVHQAYSFQETQPVKLKPKRYLGEPITKLFGIGLAVIAFPIAGYAAREMAENKEFEETIESVNKLAAVQEEIQQRVIDNKVSADGYEAMKSYEMADTVDRFRETFRQEINVDDIELQLQADQRKLEQSQNYKTLEFDVASRRPQDRPKQRKWSEQAQRFYEWLMGRNDLPEVINSDWVGKQSFDGNKMTKDTWIPLVHELVAELLAEWVEQGKSFKLV